MTVKYSYAMLIGLLLTVAGGSALPWLFRSGQSKSSIPQALKFSKTVYDFGTAFQNDEIRNKVTVHNELKAPVRIVKAKAGCRCATILDDLVGRLIQPGQSLDIPIVIETGVSSGIVNSSFALVGEVNGSERSLASCLIRTNVRPDYELSRKKVDFGLVDIEEAAVKTELTLTPLAEADIAITAVSVSNKIFGAVVEPTTSGSKIRIQITFDPNSIRGSATDVFTSLLTINTTSKRTPTTEVSLYAKLDNSIKVIPSAIVFVNGLVNEKSIVVVSTNGDEFEILSTEYSNDKILRSDRVFNERSKRQTVNTHLHGGFNANQRQERLTIRCSLRGKERLLEVPIYFVYSEE